MRNNCRDLAQVIVLATLIQGLGFFQLPLVWGALGGGVDSIQADAQSLSATLKKPEPRAGEKGAQSTQSTQGAKTPFTVQEMVVAGVSIREYLSPAGIVFGIAWNGPHHPNFRALLGNYQGEYDAEVQAKAQRKHRGARGQNIQSENLIVQYQGHLRNMKGVAYVPSLLPSGVSVNDIR